MSTFNFEYIRPTKRPTWCVPGIPPGPYPDEPLPPPDGDRPGENPAIPIPDDTDIDSQHRPQIDPSTEDPLDTPKDPPIRPDEPPAPLIAGMMGKRYLWAKRHIYYEQH